MWNKLPKNGAITFNTKNLFFYGILILSLMWSELFILTLVLFKYDTSYMTNGIVHFNNFTDHSGHHRKGVSIFSITEFHLQVKETLVKKNKNVFLNTEKRIKKQGKSLTLNGFIFVTMFYLFRASPYRYSFFYIKLCCSIKHLFYFNLHKSSFQKLIYVQWSFYVVTLLIWSIEMEEFWGCIFIHVWFFYEWAVSNLDPLRSMHRLV